MGGPLKYLDTWEQATSKFNRLAEKGEHMTGELLVQLLGLKFKAINDTETLFEQAKGEANNFDELCSALRKKLAQREYIQEQDAKDNAQMNFTSLQPVIPAQTHNYNTNYNDPGWRVDQNLWEILPPETKKNHPCQKKREIERKYSGI